MKDSAVESGEAQQEGENTKRSKQLKVEREQLTRVSISIPTQSHRHFTVRFTLYSPFLSSMDLCIVNIYRTLKLHETG
jgi:hypothetical protein